MQWNRLKPSILLCVALCFSTVGYADSVWIDVRSVLEHKIDHIEGDVRISYGEIVAEVETMQLPKDSEIRLYCLSGGRAGVALRALQQAGYTDVRNVGSIRAARKERGL